MKKLYLHRALATRRSANRRRIQDLQRDWVHARAARGLLQAVLQALPEPGLHDSLEVDADGRRIVSRWSSHIAVVENS